jgi:hypothetical protein
MKTSSAIIRNVIARILVLDPKKVEDIRLETDRLGKPRILFGGWVNGEIASHGRVFTHILGTRADSVGDDEGKELFALYEKLTSNSAA